MKVAFLIALLPAVLAIPLNDAVSITGYRGTLSPGLSRQPQYLPVG